MTEDAIKIGVQPGVIQADSDDIPQIAVASQWRLMWWKFKKHRLAMVSLIIIATMYTIAIFANFFAPQNKATYSRNYTQAPPQTIHWFDGSKFGPYVYAYKQETDPKTFARHYAVDKSKKIPLAFFVKGDSYNLGFRDVPIKWVSKLHIATDIRFIFSGPMIWAATCGAGSFSPRKSRCRWGWSAYS
jgi:hypothetical protein